MNKATSLEKTVVLLWHTTTLLIRSPYCKKNQYKMLTILLLCLQPRPFTSAVLFRVGSQFSRKIAYDLVRQSTVPADGIIPGKFGIPRSVRALFSSGKAPRH